MKGSEQKNKEQKLLTELKNGNKSAFIRIFELYYKDLVLFGGNFIKDKSKVEDVVQSVFLKIWENRHELTITASLKSYLLTSVQNECLDKIKRSKIIRFESIDDFASADKLLRHDTKNYLLYSELKENLDKAVENMPDKYRSVYTLGKINGLKYKEISSILMISERAVEHRMSEALKHIKRFLGDFSPYLILLLLTILK